MKKLLSAFVLASMLLPSTAGSWTATAAQMTHYGEAAALGNGTVRTYVTVDSAAGGGMMPLALGVEFTRGSLTNLPTMHGGGSHCMTAGGETHCEYLLPLPEAAASVTPFQWMTLDWNPGGHPPPRIYDQPHFDFHYYLTPQEERAAIRPGSCEGPMPGPPAPVDCATMQRAMMPVPAPVVPPGHINPGAVVPQMGAHLLNPTGGEFRGNLFTRTFIWGAFNGDITFMEPMITLAHLQAQVAPVCDSITHPRMFASNGWYPTEYCIRFDPVKGNHTVSLENFVQHNDRSALVDWTYQQHLCRAAEPGGLSHWSGTNLPLSGITWGVSMSDEGKRVSTVRALYQELLNRDPVTGGDCTGLRSWSTSSLSAEEIRAAIMASAEYRAQPPRSKDQTGDTPSM